MPKKADYILRHYVWNTWDIWVTVTSDDIGRERRMVIPPDSNAWFEWLAAIPSSFSLGCFLDNRYYHFTARKEKRGQRTYWYAYMQRAGKVKKEYLGKTEDLTSKLLEEKARLLAERMN